MIISVASGKGGTGKTSVAAGLALALAGHKKITYLDCDVEEPNGHILLKPELQTSANVSILTPEIDHDRCNYCGYCSEICAFNAIVIVNEVSMVFKELCHSCGGCWYFCPQKAITPTKQPIGIIEEGVLPGIRFAHGKLNVGVAISPPLIEEVKKRVDPDNINIIDAPPGTSCPVIKAVDGSDFCILVTEPTPFGLHDLDLAYQVTTQLKIPVGVVVNRSDGTDLQVDDYCKRHKIPILLKLPLDRKVAEAYAAGFPSLTARPEWKNLFIDMMGSIGEMVSS